MNLNDPELLMILGRVFMWVVGGAIIILPLIFIYKRRKRKRGSLHRKGNRGLGASSKVRPLPGRAVSKQRRPNPAEKSSAEQYLESLVGKVFGSGYTTQEERKERWTLSTIMVELKKLNRDLEEKKSETPSEEAILAVWYRKQSLKSIQNKIYELGGLKEELERYPEIVSLSLDDFNNPRRAYLKDIDTDEKKGLREVEEKLNFKRYEHMARFKDRILRAWGEKTSLEELRASMKGEVVSEYGDIGQLSPEKARELNQRIEEVDKFIDERLMEIEAGVGE